VLLLEKEGRIAFDDPVVRYVPDPPAVDPSATIHQYLNHTAGIGNYVRALSGLPTPWPTVSYDDLMAMARVHGQQSAPGVRFDYNNTNLSVLARLCETVTGQAYETLLRERILAPLGLSDTTVGFGDASRRARFAKGYYYPTAAPDQLIDFTTVPDLSIAFASGDVTSSLPDLCRWYAALRDPDNSVGLTLADFTAGAADIGAGESMWFWPRTYGRGAEGWVWAGRPAWGHRGTFFGYHSATFLEPQTGAVVSMFATVRTAGSLHRFIEFQGYDYMRFIGDALTLAADVIELP